MVSKHGLLKTKDPLLFETGQMSRGADYHIVE